MEVTIGTLVLDIAEVGPLVVIEILIAEMLFLYHLEKRKNFALRYAVAALLSCGYWVAYKLLRGEILGGIQWIAGEAMGASLENLALYISTLAVTIAAMRFCFTGPFSMIFYACTAGYALQHFAYKFYDIIVVILHLRERITDYPVNGFVIECLCHVVIYVIGYFVFVRPAEKQHFRSNGDPMLNALSIAIILIGTGINRFAMDFALRTDIQIVADSLYAMTCCAFALIVRFSLFERSMQKTELELSKALVREQGKQYHQWKTNLETLNIKYHDLRHELNVLKDVAKEAGAEDSIHRLEHLIDESFSFVHTGNEMLDVLLSSKKSLCEKNKINFTCTVDGQALSKLNSSELFSLFCNALDNAIESVSRIQKEEKRVIDLGIKQYGGFVDIHLQNYYEGEIDFMDGLPVPESENAFHGFGMKSMKNTAQMLGGAMSVHAENGIFNLQFVIPTYSERG